SPDEFPARCAGERDGRHAKPFLTSLGQVKRCCGPLREFALRTRLPRPCQVGRRVALTPGPPSMLLSEAYVFPDTHTPLAVHSHGRVSDDPDDGAGRDFRLCGAILAHRPWSRTCSVTTGAEARMSYDVIIVGGGPAG